MIVRETQNMTISLPSTNVERQILSGRPPERRIVPMDPPQAREIGLMRFKKCEGICFIPDDHVDSRRYTFFMARSVLRECGGTRNSPVDCFPAKRNGVLPC
ncbi:MAG: hypothetical protein ACI8Z1_004060 [Candidatus Azotimanducaceae bacterium]|jgi:hypothetical protein